MDAFYYNPPMDHYASDYRGHSAGTSPRDPRYDLYERTSRTNLQPTRDSSSRWHSHGSRSHYEIRRASSPRDAAKFSPQPSPNSRRRSVKTPEINKVFSDEDHAMNSADEDSDALMSSLGRYRGSRGDETVKEEQIFLPAIRQDRLGVQRFHGTVNDAVSGTERPHGEKRRASHSEVSRHGMYRRGSSPHDNPTIQLHFGGHEVKDFNRNSSPSSSSGSSSFRHRHSTDETRRTPSPRHSPSPNSQKTGAYLHGDRWESGNGEEERSRSAHVGFSRRHPNY